MTCTRCSINKAKRDCPALDAVICAKCCAAGREGSVNCPLTCEFLITAHQFEKKTADPREIPNQDIPADKAFLRRNEYLIVLIGATLLHATHLQADVDDRDLLAVLSSLVAMWREYVPDVMKGPHVADRAVVMIADRVAREIHAHRKQITQSGSEPPHNYDVLGSLAFLTRTAYGMNNGRPRCRSFLGFLNRSCTYEAKIKDEPLVVLA